MSEMTSLRERVESLARALTMYGGSVMSISDAAYLSREASAIAAALSPPALEDGYLAEVLARLQQAVTDRVGSTVMLTKADACAIGSALLRQIAAPAPAQQAVTDEMVERGCAAVAVAAEFDDKWPEEYTEEQQTDLRASVRAAITAALAPNASKAGDTPADMQEVE